MTYPETDKTEARIIIIYLQKKSMTIKKIDVVMVGTIEDMDCGILAGQMITLIQVLQKPLLLMKDLMLFTIFCDDTCYYCPADS